MDEMDRSTAGHDEEHAARLDVQAEIQDVLDELQREMAGASVENVTVAINRRLADAGVPEQPHRWVQGMAERISTGRAPIADTAAAVDAVRVAESGPADDTALVDTGPGLGIDDGAPQDADGHPAHDPTEMTGDAAVGRRLGGDSSSGPTLPEPESVEPGAVPESQATPPPANPR
ncbi:MAG TPA: hypothetical protein VFL94_01400 [Actinomycetales bacterium]|nr:hypothetical protein [Actinomycetales bacterium]